MKKDRLQRDLAKDEYVHGRDLVVNGHFEAGFKALNDFYQKNPSSRFSLSALFYLGRAHEGLGRWQEASEAYSEVATHPSVSQDLRAKALYRGSFVYEAMGENLKTVAALEDVFKRRQLLPLEVAEAEVPARLAGAYARVGQNEQSLKYYKIAEKGILQLRRRQDKPPAWLSKTLFYMGSMSVGHIQHENFESGIRPLLQAQLYLLQAAELNNEKWSDMASEKLVGIYEHLWQVVERLPLDSSEDELLARRERQSQQWRMTHQILNSLEQLKLSRLPEAESSSRYVGKIYEYVDYKKQKLTSFLNQRPLGEGITPSAEQRQGLKRRGRTGGASVLENNLSDKDKYKKTSEDPNL